MIFSANTVCLCIYLSARQDVGNFAGESFNYAVADHMCCALLCCSLIEFGRNGIEQFTSPGIFDSNFSLSINFVDFIRLDAK